MNGDYGLDTMEDSILSLSDPTYKHILEGFFIRLGPKMKGKKKKVNESELTEAEAAEEVFNIFKNKGGRLLKRQKDWREKNASVVAVDDEEARKSKYHTMTGDCLTFILLRIKCCKPIYYLHIHHQILIPKKSEQISVGGWSQPNVG